MLALKWTLPQSFGGWSRYIHAIKKAYGSLRAYTPKAMEAHRARKEAATPAARVRVVEKDGRPEIQPDHPDRLYGELLLLRALGTTSPDFVEGIFRQLATFATLGQKPDQDALNFMLSIIGVTSRRF